MLMLMEIIKHTKTTQNALNSLNNFHFTDCVEKLPNLKIYLLCRKAFEY